MLAQTFGCVRVVWNDALAASKDRDNKYQGFVAASRQLTASKKSEDRAWLNDVSCVPLQQSIRNLDKAYQRFFKGLKGKGPRSGAPKFKKRNHEQCAQFTRSGFSIKNGKLVLSKIGPVEVRWSRELPSYPKTATVKLNASGRYHVSFTVEKGEMPLFGGTPVGIDLGIKAFAALSTGEIVEAPSYVCLERKIRVAQKKLSRCKKGSNRRDKARLRVAKLHAKVADKRKDFIEKLSTKLVREHSHISLEDLNVSGMVKNHNLARAISRQGWRTFREAVAQKCLRYGRTFGVVNRWEPTSQVCSGCGYKWGKLHLGIREVTCPECGEVHDRDTNAAKNIVAAGHVETLNGRGDWVRHGDASHRALVCEASTA